MKLDKFDSCALAASEHMAKTVKSGGFAPSAIHDMAVPMAVKGAMTDVVTKHFNSDMSSAEAAKRLADAVKLARE